MLGGIFTSFILELVVYPAIYEIWKWHGLKRELALAQPVEWSIVMRIAVSLFAVSLFVGSLSAASETHVGVITDTMCGANHAPMKVSARQQVRRWSA